MDDHTRAPITVKPANHNFDSMSYSASCVASLLSESSTNTPRRPQLPSFTPSFLPATNLEGKKMLHCLETRELEGKISQKITVHLFVRVRTFERNTHLWFCSRPSGANACTRVCVCVRGEITRVTFGSAFKCSRSCQFRVEVRFGQQKRRRRRGLFALYAP